MPLLFPESINLSMAQFCRGPMIADVACGLVRPSGPLKEGPSALRAAYHAGQQAIACSGLLVKNSYALVASNRKPQAFAWTTSGCPACRHHGAAHGGAGGLLGRNQLDAWSVVFSNSASFPGGICAAVRPHLRPREVTRLQAKAGHGLAVSTSMWPNYAALRHWGSATLGFVETASVIGCCARWIAVV